MIDKIMSVAIDLLQLFRSHLFSDDFKELIQDYCIEMYFDRLICLKITILSINIGLDVKE